jgi:hypothetical protein
MTGPPPRRLHRILGLGFGLALAFGSTVGVGILRLPGLVAAQLGDRGGFARRSRLPERRCHENVMRRQGGTGKVAEVVVSSRIPA